MALYYCGCENIQILSHKGCIIRGYYYDYTNYGLAGTRCEDVAVSDCEDLDFCYLLTDTDCEESSLDDSEKRDAGEKNSCSRCAGVLVKCGGIYFENECLRYRQCLWE